MRLCAAAVTAEEMNEERLNLVLRHPLKSFIDFIDGLDIERCQRYPKLRCGMLD